MYLNDTAFWGGVPAAVWRYRLGGYQVLKNGCPAAKAPSSAAI